VVDPFHLREEVRGLRDRGIEVRLGANLLLSDAAHLILPVHRILDQHAEHLRGDARIGTTGRGIGPAYSDRAARTGIRAGDLIRPARLDEARARWATDKTPLLAALGAPPLDIVALREELLRIGDELRPAIVDTGRLLRDAQAAGRRILAEGA